MSLTLEFADSEVSAVVLQGADLCVRFSAASATDADGTTGYLPAVELVFHAAAWQGDIAMCFGRVAEGHLLVAGSVLRRFPMPYQATGPASAEMHFRQGQGLVVQCSAVTARVDGPATLRESYAC